MVTAFALDRFLRLTVKPLWRRDVSVPQLRAKAAFVDRWLARFGAKPTSRRFDMAGVAVDCIGPDWSSAPTVVLYLHGGAFCFDLPATYRRFAVSLSRRTGMPVLLPDYRLAPEHPFPAGLDDCFAVYRWLLDKGLFGRRLVLMGDSAGGNFALGTMMRARDAQLPMPGCAVLFSPSTDLSGGSPSIEDNEASDPIFSREALVFVKGVYVPNTPTDHREVSPLLNDWQGLPPLLIQASRSEMLRDDSVRAVERAAAAGVSARLSLFEGMPHVFQLIEQLGASRRALDEATLFIGEYCAAPAPAPAQTTPEPTVAALPATPPEGAATMDPLITRMQATFASQRDACLREPFPNINQRKADLRALKTLLQRYQDEIPAAVSADFGGRAPAESKLVEVVGPVMEINHALSSLRGWMKPRRRHTELVFLGNSAWVEYQPKGVVGVISPWNFPLYLAVGPLVAALATGNRVMIKMSEFSPHSTELLARMLAEAFPEDKVAVFGGEVEAAQAFSALPFNHIVFTGSPAVGVHVMRAAAANLTPVTLELGGKSPALVAQSADVADAAKRIAHGKTFNGGQICVSPDYALVPQQHIAPFVAEVQASFRRMIPTLRGNHDYTSIITRRHADRIRELLADARAKGATVTACGDEDTPTRIPLHIVTGVREDMLLATEELFGPILPVIPYDSVDQAIGYINARPRPLALYPFGFGSDELRKITSSTHSGNVTINDWGWHAFNHDLPFGGTGNSGMGSYHGEEGFRELSHAKGMFKRKSWFPIGLFYPPYGNWVQSLVMRYYLGKVDPTVLPSKAPARVQQG